MASPPSLPRLPLSERLRRAGVAAWSLIGIFIVAIAAAWVLFKIRIIFPPLILAILIIYLLNPIVSRLERRRVSRVWGTILAYVVVLGSTFVLITAITPFVSRQLQSFSEDWPEFKVQIVAAADDASNWFADRTGA
ncbi:MAG TPA: AI-2E family transporter, partial [Actinomycetota bacterium]|nr:AI-2E family transporter [Actinomycetota bacterium]